MPRKKRVTSPTVVRRMAPISVRTPIVTSDSRMSAEEPEPKLGVATPSTSCCWSLFAGGTEVTIVHVWDGPPLPFIGIPAATVVIGPVFIHGIASRTLAGLAGAAERQARRAD